MAVVEVLCWYRAILAPNAAWRKEVVPKPKPEAPEAAAERRAKRLTRTPRIRIAEERPSWADLLQRVFTVDSFTSAAPGAENASNFGVSS